MGFNCLKAADPLRRSSLLFTTKFPDIPGTHLIDLVRMKVCESTLEPPSGFEHSTPGLGIQHFGDPALVNMTEPLIFFKS